MTSKNVHIIPQNTPKVSSIPASKIDFASLNNKIATMIRLISAIDNSNKCNEIKISLKTYLLFQLHLRILVLLEHMQSNHL